VITGFVTSEVEAVIRLSVYGSPGQVHDINGVIDTGFDGSLTIPPEMIAELNLHWRRRGQGILADGTARVFDIYRATVDWDGEQRHVDVHEANATPLVGMALMRGFELRIQVVDGGTVIIESLP